MKVVNWAIGKLKPYAKNPRVNDRAVKAVARSIHEFGFRQPIVVDAKGVVIVGHTRLKAAKQLKLKTVPVHVATGLSEAQKRAYRLADNQTADLAAWDYEKLIAELLVLKDKDDFDLTALGFGGRRLADLIEQDAGDGEAAGPDDLPPAWQVLVQCTDEAHQRKVYKQLTKEGLKCRLLIS